MRVKRGIKDTSQLGGMYKDQVYLIGAIEILKSRKKIDFLKFFSVKMGVQDYLRQEKLKLTNIFRQIVVNDQMLRPYFLKDMETYLQKLDLIAQTNFV